MLALGDVRFGAEEIVRLRRVDEELELVASWDWCDVPVLMALPEVSRFRWAHFGEDGDGLPVRVRSWEVCRDPPGCRVSIRFEVGDE